MDGFPEPGGDDAVQNSKVSRAGRKTGRRPEGHLRFGSGVQRRHVVGRDTTIDRIKNEHDAIFVAAGASSSTRIPLEGRDKESFGDGSTLRDVALGKDVQVGGRVG